MARGYKRRSRGGPKTTLASPFGRQMADMGRKRNQKPAASMKLSGGSGGLAPASPTIGRPSSVPRRKRRGGKSR